MEHTKRVDSIYFCIIRMESDKSNIRGNYDDKARNLSNTKHER